MSEEGRDIFLIKRGGAEGKHNKSKYLKGMRFRSEKQQTNNEYRNRSMLRPAIGSTSRGGSTRSAPGNWWSRRSRFLIAELATGFVLVNEDDIVLVIEDVIVWAGDGAHCTL